MGFSSRGAIVDHDALGFKVGFFMGQFLLGGGFGFVRRGRHLFTPQLGQGPQLHGEFNSVTL